MTKTFKALYEVYYGATIPFRSLWLILRTPSLLAWSSLPVFLTLLLFAVGFFQAHEMLRVVVQAFWAARGWNPQGMGSVILRYLIELLLFLASAMSFTFIASLVAVPFNDLLAEATESRINPPLNQCAKLPFLARLRLLSLDLGKGIFSGVSAFLLVFLSWIPGVQLVAYPLTAILVALQFISFPSTRRRFNLGNDFRMIRRHLWVCLGYGSATAVSLAIPFLSAFFLPVAVVGGTMLFGRCMERDLANQPR